MKTNDASENRYIAYLSYLSILFLIPKFARPKSLFCQFHARQGFGLFVFQMILAVVNGILSILNLPLGIDVGFGYVLAVLRILYFTLIVVGVINITKGECNELPITKRFAKIIK